MSTDRRPDLVAALTAAFAEEIDRHAPTDAVPWPWWPDARALVGHLGGIHGWAARVLRTGEEVPDPEDLPAPDDARAWYLGQRTALLDALRSVPSDAPVWVFAGHDASAGFWRRRMVFETAKHLADLRAAGGGTWRPPAELEPADYADGIDELLGVFLARSRPGLAPLPGSVVLEATDSDRSWLVTSDWVVLDDDVIDAARITAATGELALVVWQRADPLSDPERFVVRGDAAVIAAFRDAPIHP